MIRSFQGKSPHINKSAYIAESAEIIGDVTIGKQSSVWPGSVLRGDLAPITIGDRSSVQDNSVIHSDPRLPTVIGDAVTLGHRVIIHSARIQGNVIIGMGGILLNDSRVGRHAIVAAGAVVREGQKIPAKSLAAGVPARILRPVSTKEIKRIEENATHYVALAQKYLSS